MIYATVLDSLGKEEERDNFIRSSTGDREYPNDSATSAKKEVGQPSWWRGDDDASNTNMAAMMMVRNL